jgi:hypothetical protein
VIFLVSKSVHGSQRMFAWLFAIELWVVGSHRVNTAAAQFEKQQSPDRIAPNEALVRGA